MEKNLSIETSYLETSRNEKTRNLFLQFKPPSETQTHVDKYRYLVVVDCSASMRGTRIEKVNRCSKVSITRKTF
jgi:hypothetical protein